MQKNGKVKLAIVGANRGQTFNQSLEFLKDKVELTCICDLSEEKVAEWKSSFPETEGFTSFEQLLEKGDFDAVFIATPVLLHTEQSIAAMNAGKHVLSEVYAANTLDECERLVDAVKKTGKVYMMAENYCYMRENMMVRNMADSGLFGTITYAEGAYIHDCRNLRFDSSGNLTWRGEGARTSRGNHYPTHSLGPVAKWMGINRKDWFKKVTTFVTNSAGMERYAIKNFGKDHDAAKPGYWSCGDSTTTVIETEAQAIIILRVDTHSARPHNITWYSLQGTKGSYLSGRHHHDEPLIWLEGYSKAEEDGRAVEWDTLWKYSYKYEHSDWARHMENASQLGHGGGDFFVIKDFVEAIINRTPPPIDVYDAVTWSSIVPLAEESLRKGGIPIDIPVFR